MGDIEEVGYVREMQELNACRKFCKLFRFGEQGASVLYVYASSWITGNFPESYSGLYGLLDGSVETLATGYQCGGSSGGDYVCSWYDKETSQRKPGETDHVIEYSVNDRRTTIEEYQKNKDRYRYLMVLE